MRGEVRWRGRPVTVSAGQLWILAALTEAAGDIVPVDDLITAAHPEGDEYDPHIAEPDPSPKGYLARGGARP